MVRQKHIFLVALAASLALHLASLGFFVGYAHLRGCGTRTQTAQGKPQARPTTAPADELIVYPEMGDAQGTGIGSNSSPGEREQMAREADEDQALLSRNPQGAGRIQARPSDRRGPEGDGRGGAPVMTPPAPAVARVTESAPKPQAPREEAASAPPPVAVVPPAPDPEAKPAAIANGAPAPVASPVPLPQPAPQADAPVPAAPRVEVASAIPVPHTSPTPSKETEPKPRPEPPQEKVAPSQNGVTSAKPQAAEPGDGRRRGVPPAAGNPLPQSESDSDPFSRISGNIVIPRVGRLDVRMGRKVKTTRPQVGVAALLDQVALNNPTVVLEVHIAPAGNVTDVRIAHSSGSNAIDEPTRVAVYDWWFEPAKDKHGKPVQDVIYFAVQFL